MARVIRLGVLGTGGWSSSSHLPAIRYIQRHCREQFEVRFAAFCDVNPECLATAGREYGVERLYTDIGAFAREVEMDCCAVIVTPTVIEPIMDALLPLGVPLLAEKPPAIDYATAQKLARLVRVPNVVAFNRRFFPINEQFKTLVDETPDLYYVDCNFLRQERYDSQPDNDHIPFVTGTAVHAINLLEYYFGAIERVQTSPLEVPTNGTRAWVAELVFAGGLRGRIKVFPCSGSNTEWIEAHSQHRSLYLRSCIYSSIDAPGRIEAHEKGVLTRVIEGQNDLEPLVARGFAGEYLELFKATAEAAPTRSNFQNAANTMRVAEAIEEGLSF